MRNFLFLLSILLLSGCIAQSPQSKLEKLQKKVLTCQHENDVSSVCKKSILQLGRLRNAAYSLKTSPQEFGLKVLDTQTQIVEINEELKSKTLSSDDRERKVNLLNRLKDKVQLYIKVIALFESPGA